MKKLLALLMAFLPGFAKAEGSKLGSEGDLIRQMLFASQSLKEQVKNSHLDGTPGPFQSIADASKLVDVGKKTEAIVLLRSVLDTPKLEARVQLWVWSALRELGQSPDPNSAYEVLGAIIEFPSGGGYDTLAGYVDGSARYLNFSGAAIFWDAEDPTIKAMCQALIDSTIPASNRAKPRASLSLPQGVPQVTMLTRSGPFVIVSPPDSVVRPGAALMMELMKRAKEKKGEPAPKAAATPLRSHGTKTDDKPINYMRTTFQVSGTIDLAADGSEYDLHNDFDFVGFEYRPTDQEARLSWRRGSGNWVPKDTPANLVLRFKGVNNFSVRQRDAEMPFTEDSCMASITFSPPEFGDDFDAVFGGFRRDDEHLSIVFQSGAAMKIWAESATHELRD